MRWDVKKGRFGMNPIISKSEKFLSAKSKFNVGSAIVGAYRREEGVDSVIIVLARPTVWESLVGMSHWKELTENTKLGGSLKGIYQNINMLDK